MHCVGPTDVYQQVTDTGDKTTRLYSLRVNRNHAVVLIHDVYIYRMHVYVCILKTGDKEAPDFYHDFT